MTAEERLAAQYGAEITDLKRRMEQTRTASAMMDRERRVRWIRQCTQPPKCEAWQLDAIVEGAPADEQRRTLRASFAAAAEDAAQNGAGELGPDPARVVAGIVARPGMGPELLDEMPAVTLASALADRANARGKVLKVSAHILDLRDEHDVVEGELLTDNKTVVHFVTAMGTTGLRRGSAATYRGVVVDLQARSGPSLGAAPVMDLVLAGAFDPPAKR